MSREIKIKPVKGAFPVDVKRFDAPAILSGECPKCGHKIEIDYSTGHHYLSYPTANESFQETLYCGECQHEWNVSMILRISLELAPRTENEQ